MKNSFFALPFIIFFTACTYVTNIVPTTARPGQSIIIETNKPVEKNEKDISIYIGGKKAQVLKKQGAQQLLVRVPKKDSGSNMVTYGTSIAIKGAKLNVIAKEDITLLAQVLNSDVGRELNQKQKDSLNLLSSSSKLPIKLYINSVTKIPAWIKLNYPVSNPDPAVNAEQFLSRFRDIFQLREVDTLARIGEITKSEHSSKTHFSQSVNGVPVFAGGVEIIQDESGISEVRGLVFPDISVTNAQKINAEYAKKSLKFVMSEEELTKINGELTVLDTRFIGLQQKKSYLTWQFALPSDHNGFVQHWFIDASSGEIITQIISSPLVKGNITLQKSGDDWTTPIYHINSETGAPDYVSWQHVGGFKISDKKYSPADAVKDFLSSHPTLFADANPDVHQKIMETTDISALGITQVKTRQHYANLPVFGVGLRYFMAPGNRLLLISGNYIPKIKVNTIPSITTEIAKSKAAVSKVKGLCNNCSESEINTLLAKMINKVLKVPELGIFPLTLPSLPPVTGTGPRLAITPSQFERYEAERTRLAYKIDFSDSISFIDAQSGKLIYSYSRIKSDGAHGGIRIFDAQGQPSADYTAYFNDIIRAEEVEPYSASASSDVNNVYEYAHSTLNYYYQRPDLFPYDIDYLDYLMPYVWSSVHFIINAVPLDQNGTVLCPNAFYSPPVFLDSIAHLELCNGFAVNDVVAHEMTHGITDNSSSLVYADESGALNEFYSDLFAQLVFPDSGGTWIIAPVGRDMENPTVKHMFNYQYPSSSCVGNYDNISCDNGGVHTNLGIPSLATIYATKGVPALPPSTSVMPGIGADKIAALSFMTLTKYLDEWSGFSDTMLGTMSTCNLWRSWGWSNNFPTPLTQNDCDVIANSFNRVGIAASTSSGWYHSSGIFGASEDYVRDDGLYMNGCTLKGYILKLQNLDDPGMRRVCSDSSICSDVGDRIDYNGGEFWAKVNSWGPAGNPRKTASIHVGRSNFEDIAVDLEFVPNVPPGLTKQHCNGDTIQRTSQIQRHWSNWGIGGKDDEWIEPVSGLSSQCIITGVTLEKLTEDKRRIGSTGREVGDNNSGARIVQDSVGSSSTKVKIHWWFNPFNIIRYRIIYTIAQPTGVICWPE